MALRMVTFYGPQVAQANEEPPSESSLNLTLNPLQALYYYIFPNSCTLVILLQIDLASSDKPETICEGCYETEDISIFAWSSIPNVRHYRWLHDSICRLPPNSKANYLIRTIRHILYFLQL
jgi:hypothetical protein